MMKMVCKVLKFTLRCWPASFSIYIFVGIASGLMLGANIWLLQSVFEVVTNLFNGTATYQTAIIIIVLFALFRVVTEIFISIYYYYMDVIGLRMQGFMCREVAKKTAKLDPIVFEEPRTLDDINKAIEATRQVGQVVNIVMRTTTFYLPFLSLTAIYLYALNPRLILVIIFIFIPKVLGVVIRSRLYMDLEDKSAPLRRQLNFYAEAMTSREYFKETRLLGAFEFFKRKYFKSVDLLNIQTWIVDSKSASIDVVMSILTVFGYLGILYLLSMFLLEGVITVGAFAAIFGNISALIWGVNELVTHNFGKLSVEMGKMAFLMNFFDFSEREGEKIALNWQGDIEFKNVSFTYPNTKKNSLSNISLTIKAGETIAIVGENGAGKSTFTKLLIGIYEPTSGEIEVGGQRINNVAFEQLFDGTSAVFQQHQRYHLSLKENIEIGAVELNDDIIPAMKEAGVEWESISYPNGIDTILSREFDGVEISGGQWQRIAIARGLYRHHDLIILDEPTAAIDPLEEKRLYEKFTEISKNKTAVIVTHRLGSAQIADKIIVLDDGKVIESGKHQELINNKGHYAKMYESQASWYIN